MQLFVWIPGILGTRLQRRSNGSEVWPPAPDAENGLDDRTFDQLTANLAATQPIDAVCIVPIYSPLDDLFRRAHIPDYDPAHPADRARLSFGFDWRMDIESQAGLLADAIDRIITRPDDQIVFVAHSMGNYLCRYLIETDVFAGRFFIENRCVKKLVSINGPHAGAPVIIARMMGLDKMDHVVRADVPRLVACAPYAGACQLLPAPDRAHFFDGQTPIDLYDPATVAEFGWGAANMDKARQFWAQLGAQKKADGVEYVIVRSYLDQDGGGQSTIANVRRLNGSFTVEKGPGDGAVPPWSAEALGPATVTLPGEHLGVFDTGQFATDVFRDHIADLIDFPQGLQPTLRLQPLRRDVPAGGKAGFALVQDMANPATRYSDGVTWFPITATGAPDRTRALVKQPLQIDDLTEATVVQLSVPNPPGPYRVVLTGLIDDEEPDEKPGASVVVSAPQ
jgi:hypothetical protein